MQIIAIHFYVNNVNWYRRANPCFMVQACSETNRCLAAHVKVFVFPFILFLRIILDQ